MTFLTIPLWTAKPITEEPEITITHWMIVEADFGDGKPTRHFVGERGVLHGRVSSEIREFDAKNLTGRTRSGRVYKLEGPAGMSEDGLYTWDWWSRINGVKSWKDVSSEYAPPNGDTK